MLGMNFPGAVWSDGSQPYLFMGMMKAYSKMKSDEWALSSATGISGGVAATIPLLFFDDPKLQTGCLAQLAQSQLELSEKVNGDDCYVLSGASETSLKETY